jgi:hypothetical protein
MTLRMMFSMLSVIAASSLRMPSGSSFGAGYRRSISNSTSPSSSKADTFLLSLAWM